MATGKFHSSDDLFLPVTNHIHHHGSAVTKQGAYAAASYMTCAVLLLMFNKAVLSSYAFPCVNVITLFQMASSCLLLYTMRYWKVISFSNDEQGHIQTSPVSIVPFRKLLHTIPVAVAYLLYMVRISKVFFPWIGSANSSLNIVKSFSPRTTASGSNTLASMESVRGISVPMYTTLRRTSVVFTIVMEYILVGQKHSRLVICSVAIIILGAMVAGARDLSFDAYSYAVVFVSNICSAIYLASVACIGKSNSLNSFGLMWCNGLLCGPILLFWTFTKGDLEVTINFPHLLSPGFQVVLVFSCILAFLLNYCVFLNTTTNSALTQSICGNLKDLFAMGLGWLVFGGLPYDLLNVIGQILGFLGSLLYAYCKLYGK